MAADVTVRLTSTGSETRTTHAGLPAQVIASRAACTGLHGRAVEGLVEGLVEQGAAAGEADDAGLIFADALDDDGRRMNTISDRSSRSRRCSWVRDACRTSIRCRILAIAEIGFEAAEVALHRDRAKVPLIPPPAVRTV